MILGLDISTSITGYTIIDHSGTVLECDHIDLKNYDGLFEKAVIAEKRLDEVFKKYSIEQVWIEASLMMFSAGKSSAKVIDTLSKFNGIVSWICFQKQKNINFIPAVSARKQIGLKMVKGKKGKEIVMEHMLNKETWFQVDLTRTDKIKPYCYDRADSFVIAKAGYLEWIKKQGLTS